MNFPEHKIFERTYPSSGCIFFPLGLAMSGLLLILMWFALSEGSFREILHITPIFIILGALAYFCFSRCRARVDFGIYPTYMTIDNKSFSWKDIQAITFEKKDKAYIIQIHLNKRYIKKYTIISILLAIACIFVLIEMGADKAIFLFIMFEAMFAINLKQPGSKMTQISTRDFETVFSYIKYYAQMYNIPVEYENDGPNNHIITM